MRLGPYTRHKTVRIKDTINTKKLKILEKSRKIYRNILAASWVKKVGVTRSCYFPTDAVNF